MGKARASKKRQDRGSRDASAPNARPYLIGGAAVVSLAVLYFLSSGSSNSADTIKSSPIKRKSDVGAAASDKPSVTKKGKPRKVGPYTIIQEFDHDRCVITCLQLFLFFSPSSLFFSDFISLHTVSSEAFTQGLLVHDGILYESTGLYGKSTLREFIN